jgi:hypothetical protein
LDAGTAALLLERELVQVRDALRKDSTLSNNYNVAFAVSDAMMIGFFTGMRPLEK